MSELKDTTVNSLHSAFRYLKTFQGSGEVGGERVILPGGDDHVCFWFFDIFQRGWGKAGKGDVVQTLSLNCQSKYAKEALQL